MKTLTLFAIALLLPSGMLYAQMAPPKQWDKTIGGNSDDYLNSLQQTTDGGYILGGGSLSAISGDKSQANLGSADYWLVKVDVNGNKQWDKTIGGNAEDYMISLQQTADGGYILGGNSNSGISSNKSEAGRGAFDYWVIKLDANGNKQWDKTLGGNDQDQLWQVRQTSDGGYIVAGYSVSGISGDKSQASNGLGFADFWIVKLDATGTKMWDKTYGGLYDEHLLGLQQTSDGGYILGGSSGSPISGDKSEASKGSSDYWIVKLDPSGNKQWDKSIGGSSNDALYSVLQTLDGGFLLVGYSDSPVSGDKSEASKGGMDAWIVKLDTNGNKQWDKTIGGNDGDHTWLGKQLSSGGYIIAGYSNSPLSGDKSDGNRGPASTHDYWIFKLDTNGNKVWDKTIGGAGNEILRSMWQSSDGGFVLGGLSDSFISGEKSQNSKGGHDFWVVKLGADITGLHEAPNLDYNLFPNPSTGFINLKVKGPQPVQISIYNSLGQCILTKTNPQPGTDGVLLDLSNEAKGVYMVRILTGDQVSTQRLVLQ